MAHSFEALLHDFGKYIGFDNLVFNEDQCCFLQFDDIKVTLQNRNNEGIQLIAHIVDLQTHTNNSQLEALLASNLVLKNETIALNLENKAVLLKSWIQKEVADLKYFLLCMESFINEAERLVNYSKSSGFPK